MHIRTTALMPQTRAQKGGSMASLRAVDRDPSAFAGCWVPRVAEQEPGTERWRAWGTGCRGDRPPPGRWHGPGETEAQGIHAVLLPVTGREWGALRMPPLSDTPKDTLTIKVTLGCAVHGGLGWLP